MRGIEAQPMESSMYRRCRLCGSADSDLIKYGVRHYAHPICYMKAGKPLSALHKWQIEQLPYFALQKYGLLEEARRLTARDRG